MAGSESLQLEPVVNDGLGAVRVGLGLWCAAGILLLLRRDELAAQGTEWWLLTCLAGALICLVEWAIFARRAANRRAREAAAGASEIAGTSG